MTNVTPIQRTGQPQQTSEATRYLCSSVFLGRANMIRNSLRTHALDQFHYIADNKDLNTRLVARVVDFFDQRTLRHNTWHGPLGVFCFLAVTVNAVSASDDTQPTIILIGIVLAIIFAIPVYLRTMKNRYGFPIGYFSRETFNEDKASQAFANSRSILEKKTSDEDKERNVTVFGGFSPFVGAGGSLFDWSLVIDTRKGKDGAMPNKFDAQDLERAIAASFRQLSLPNLNLGERLFVHGQQVGFVEGLLPFRLGRPRRSISDETFARFRSSDSREARVYQFVEVSEWGEQVYITFFYRAALKGPMLYLENHSCVLQPVSLDYRKVDELAEPSFKEKVGTFIALAIFAPLICAWECFELLGFMRRRSECKNLEKQEKRKINEQKNYNYGALQSLREDVSSSTYDHFFEKADRELWTKAIQKQLLDSVIEFLEEHSVDTSELRDQSSLIVNSGLIVHGDVQAGALAVGDKAKAKADPGKGKRGRGAKMTAGAGE
jgi:hypothetical protein